jgi:hypothetical protein
VEGDENGDEGAGYISGGGLTRDAVVLLARRAGLILGLCCGASSALCNANELIVFVAVCTCPAFS